MRVFRSVLNLSCCIRIYANRKHNKTNKIQSKHVGYGALLYLIFRHLSILCICPDEQNLNIGICAGLAVFDQTWYMHITYALYRIEVILVLLVYHIRP